MPLAFHSIFLRKTRKSLSLYARGRRMLSRTSFTSPGVFKICRTERQRQEIEEKEIYSPVWTCRCPKREGGARRRSYVRTFWVALTLSESEKNGLDEFQNDRAADNSDDALNDDGPLLLMRNSPITPEVMR